MVRLEWLTAAQATQHQTYHNAFDTALGVSSNPVTRTRGVIEATGAARTTLAAKLAIAAA